METKTQEQERSAAQTLLGEVADQIASSNDVVRARLVNEMVDREVASRVDTLDAAFKKRQQMQRDLKKTSQPDIPGSFNADGSLATPGTFSKARLGEIKKANEKLQKLESAMERALTEGDFQKLKEVVGQK